MIEIPVEILSDEKGYYDRQCPNSECEYVFKIFMADWKEKVSDEEVYCPMCGHTAASEKWNTNEQLESMEKLAIEWAKSYIQGELNKKFSNLSRSTRHNKFFQVSYKPSKKITFRNNPIGQREEWEVDIFCENCGTRYSVIGSAYFCPCCGHNAVDNVFDESLDTIQKMLASKNEMFITFEQMYGKDKADTMCRSLLEGSLGDIVSAFQKFAVERYIKLSAKKVRPNDFQLIEKGSTLFSEVSGHGYDSWLSDIEIKYMNLMFQRRHIVEHNNGFIDERYIQKSFDTNYKIGQRLVVKDEDVIKLIGIIKKLGEGLKTPITV